jgi:molybdate transport system permease protein
VFLSADQEWMDYLAGKNLIRKDSRLDLLGNELVLIAAKDGPKSVKMEKGFDLAASFEGRLAVGDPASVPVGMYAQQAMENLGWWAALKGRLAPTADVRSGLRLVEVGEARVGIVYATDAATSKKVTVIGVFPADTHKPILYPVALTAGASPAAERFLRALQGEPAKQVFLRYGFIFVPKTAATGPATSSAQTQDIGPAVMLSLKVALWCVAAVTVPGIALGWLLARRNFAGKSVLNALVHAPLVLPPVVIGYVALLTLGRYGPVGRWLDAMDIHLAFTWQGAVVVAAVMAMPLMVRAVRLAIELADVRLEQAAATLGASPLRVFATITLPLALPGVVSGLVLAFARALGEFGATITFVGNIEGQTRTLPLAIYSLTSCPGGESSAMTLVLASLGLSLGALLVSEALASRLRARLAVA